MTRAPHFKLIISALCFSFALGFKNLLEADPVTHVLVQLPLLALAGTLCAQSYNIPKKSLERWDFAGLNGGIILIVGIFFWMLPRHIDAALESALFDVLKFVSVPVLVGFPLAWSWPRLHPLIRGFLKANAISMLGILAFLYTHAPIRICNAYLVGDQERLGYGFLYIAFALALLWSVPLFFPPKKPSLNLPHLKDQKI